MTLIYFRVYSKFLWNSREFTLYISNGDTLDSQKQRSPLPRLTPLRYCPCLPNIQWILLYYTASQGLMLETPFLYYNLHNPSPSHNSICRSFFFIYIYDPRYTGRNSSSISLVKYLKYLRDTGTIFYSDISNTSS